MCFSFIHYARAFARKIDHHKTVQLRYTSFNPIYNFDFIILFFLLLIQKTSGMFLFNQLSLSVIPLLVDMGLSSLFQHQCNFFFLLQVLWSNYYKDRTIQNYIIF
jgi:hypothetical protein